MASLARASLAQISARRGNKTPRRHGPKVVGATSPFFELRLDAFRERLAVRLRGSRRIGGVVHEASASPSSATGGAFARAGASGSANSVDLGGADRGGPGRSTARHALPPRFG